MLEDGESGASRSGTDELTSTIAKAPTLLVIDDDTVHRMIICRIANRAGFEATGAASYDDAVRLLGENVYTAITLDLSLGQHGGVDILHVIAAMDCPPTGGFAASAGASIRAPLRHRL